MRTRADAVDKHPLPCSIEQCSIAQHGAAQHSIEQQSTTQRRAAQRRAAQHSEVSEVLGPVVHPNDLGLSDDN